ncbi:MAG: mannose-1-phosphate guanylyltransferase [Desulfosalsimonas sp.]|uniref:mannose-1-phosphate guanylyltransferase n=1 Tax=Desulfosalsimonas sp. TaxID=3073848 RepID=UPI0039708310
MENLFGIILAGGKGERFWPMSRGNRPKQLLPIISDKTMLEETVERLEGFIDNERIFTVSTEHLHKPIAELNVLEEDNVLTEPFGRNTALAIGYSAVKMRHINENSTMLVCPADHEIASIADFKKTVELGYKYAQQDNLVTFGITPTRPEIGYGYIELGKPLEDEKVYEIEAFKEKPNLKVASAYLKSGNTLWNSGIFLWKTSAILSAIENYIPDMYESLQKFSEHIGKDTEQEALKKLYDEAPATSIDFGVMERADNIVIVRAQFKWDDVGNWNALERTREADDEGNVVHGNVITMDSENNVIYSEDGLIATVGVNDVVVVRTKDVTLVCNKRDTGQIKALLKQINDSDKLKEYL